MPYEGEFAGYRPLQRIAETERVKSLLKKSRVLPTNAVGAPALSPKPHQSLVARFPSTPLPLTAAGPRLTLRMGTPVQKLATALSPVFYWTYSKLTS